ncbi:hypothetical protein Prudu_018000, partial [Prunus dulcis]
CNKINGGKLVGNLVGFELDGEFTTTYEVGPQPFGEIIEASREGPYTRQSPIFRSVVRINHKRRTETYDVSEMQDIWTRVSVFLSLLVIPTLPRGSAPSFSLGEGSRGRRVDHNPLLLLVGFRWERKGMAQCQCGRLTYTSTVREIDDYSIALVVAKPKDNSL